MRLAGAPRVSSPTGTTRVGIRAAAFRDSLGVSGAWTARRRRRSAFLGRSALQPEIDGDLDPHGHRLAAALGGNEPGVTNRVERPPGEGGVARGALHLRI